MCNVCWKWPYKSGWLFAATAFAAALLVGWSASAQTNSFTVSVKGTITQRNGTKIKVGDVPGQKGCSELVSTCANKLVMTVDEDDNFVQLNEVQTGATNMIVKNIWSSIRVAATAAGQFDAALGSEITVNLPNGLPAFNGAVIADGKISTGSKTSFSGKLTGVWNDSAFNASDPAAVFKGTIKSTGTIETPGDF